MAAEHADPFANFKAAQREAWASFLPVEVITKDLTFDRDTLTGAALSLAHFRTAQEKTIGLLTTLVASLGSDPTKLAALRAAFDALARDIYDEVDNTIRMPFLMTRATKV